jgi:hypothetical protein
MEVNYQQAWDEYFKVQALGSGGIAKLLKSPQHFKFNLDHPSEATAAQVFGIAVHALLADPVGFEDLYVVAPTFDKRTKAGKAGFAAWLDDNKGKIGLDVEEATRVKGCANAVMAHPAARKLIEGGKTEVSCYWRDNEYDIPCKARFDALNLGGAIDLKTAADASKEAFAASIVRYGYHEQASHYWTGHEHCFNASPEFWCWIVVESEPPHAVAVYQCGMATLLAGRQRCNEAYGRYRDALRSGQWRGYPETIEVIEVPTWARRF